MRKLFFFLSLAMLSSVVKAQLQIEPPPQIQPPKEEFKKNLRLSGGEFLAYPIPRQRKQTPAPEGKRLFYVSHYGHFGSHHHEEEMDYDYALNCLTEADDQGMLTTLGKDVLDRIRRMKAEAYLRWGELTEVGLSQQRVIISRMFERFRPVFGDGAHVEAHSTIDGQTVLAMGVALQQLLLLNQKLDIHQDASLHEMYYMSQQDSGLQAERLSAQKRQAFDAFCKKRRRWQRMVGALFNDKDYLEQRVDGEKLNRHLFRLASNLQSSELRKEMTFYDLYTDNEIYENWQKENVLQYLTNGFSQYDGGDQPYSQRNLLRRIIQQTDSCIKMSHPGSTLRFGHEMVIMPLVCLLGLDGYDQQVGDLDQLEKRGWVDYRVLPMGANIQFAFYRKNASDKDVLFKILLNENEATLPLNTDIAPYYHWDDFRDYYLQRINAYDENLAE